MIRELLKKIKQSDKDSLIMCLNSGETYVVKIDGHYVAVNDIVRDNELERNKQWSCGKV